MSRKGFTRDLARMAKIFNASVSLRMGTIKFAAIILCVLVCISAIVAGVTLAIDVIGTDSGFKYDNSGEENSGIGEEPGTLSEPEEVILQTEPSALGGNYTGLPVTIKILCDGEEKSADVTKRTVLEALIEAGYKINENDFISPAGNSEVYNGMVVTVLRTTIEVHEYFIDIPYETEYRESPDLYEDESRVVQEGAFGSRKITLQQTLYNGMMIENKTISSLVIADPITQIIEKGTKKKTTATTKATTRRTTAAATTKAEPPEIGEGSITVNGVVYNITQTLNGEATAYYSSTGMTATGNAAIPGKTVAVNPNIIPLGSMVMVVSLDDGKTWTYGPAYAHDMYNYEKITGTFVDLYMSNYSACVSFGRRNCVIYIITPAS